MIFARKCDDNLASLVKQLDKVVGENADKKCKGFVGLLGDSRDELEAAAKEFGEANKITHLAVTVPVEFENGPANYGLSTDAEVTVLLYTKKTVVANHAFGPGELDEKGIKAVLASVPKLFE